MWLKTFGHILERYSDPSVLHNFYFDFIDTLEKSLEKKNCQVQLGAQVPPKLGRFSMLRKMNSAWYDWRGIFRDQEM